MKVAKSILMSHYHQPLSEINEMSIDDLIFFTILKSSQDQYEAQETKKAQKKIKSQRFRR